MFNCFNEAECWQVSVPSFAHPLKTNTSNAKRNTVSIAFISKIFVDLLPNETASCLP
jgi:hypothetical protein